MEEIKVGEYVRIKQGYIGKVENINDFRPPETRICIDFKSKELFFTDGEEITKHSPNIIDLIEPGDYVNGSRVVYFMIDEEKSIKEGIDEKIGVEVEDEWGTIAYLIKDIKTILTKEQYEANCYEVK